MRISIPVTTKDDEDDMREGTGIDPRFDFIDDSDEPQSANEQERHDETEGTDGDATDATDTDDGMGDAPDVVNDEQDENEDHFADVDNLDTDEPPVDDGTVERLRDENEELRERCKKLEESNASLLRDWKRFRERTANERERERAEASVDIVKRILPVLDNFERSIEHGRGDATVNDEFVNGIVGIANGIMSVIASAGVEVIDPLGEPFDMTMHCAIEQKGVDGMEPNTVYNVFQKGYRIGDKVIRPATVGVSR